MALIGPSIPAAFLQTTQGKQLVHPASDQWWENLQPLRVASRNGRLTCPDCGQRLVFCCEGLPTPYFKHYRDTEGCLDNAGRSASISERRQSAWLRHQLVVAFRKVLPPGTRMECDEYLANRRSTIPVVLPSGRGFVLEIASHPLELAVLSERRSECQAAGTPLFVIFTSNRAPEVVKHPPGAASAVSFTGLNADHDAAAQPLVVDIAHVARERFYDLPLLGPDPRTLYFFLPGRTQDDPATLAILRGLMPAPDETVWHGRLLTAPMVGEGRGPVRFSLRHGFYSEEDKAVLRWCRDRFRRRRHRGARVPARPAEHRKPPLVIKWAEWRAEKQAEVDRQRAEAEAERLRQEEQRQRLAQIQAQQLRERRAAQQALQEQQAQAKAFRKEAAAKLWAALHEEGLQLLPACPVPVPYPQIYRGDPLEWQSRLVGFAFRAGISFSLDNAVQWLQDKGFVSLYRPDLERTNMHRFWTVLAEAGIVRYASDRAISPAPVPGAFRWPITLPTEGAGQVAVCFLCGEVTPRWKVYDPTCQVCKCDRCG